MNQPAQFFISIVMAGCGDFHLMHELYQEAFEPLRNYHAKKGNKII
jgi:hypothetical protein